MKRVAGVVLFFATIALGVVGIAFAGPDADPWVRVSDQKRFFRPTRFEQEVWATFIDAGVVTTGALNVNSLSFTPRGRGTVIYDFPSLSGPNLAINTVCADSAAGTATGCAFGDGVVLGIDQAPVNGFIQLTAHVSAAGAFVVRACCVGITDGGSCNMPDASYTGTCVR